MIVSRRGKFVFFHNPKVGGASVHHNLEDWHDVPERLAGLNPEGSRWMSHLGVDEFAEMFPERWEEVFGFRHYALWRAPWDRFLSGVYQYSKSHAEVDIRFLDAEGQRKFTLDLVEKLSAIGAAEATMDKVELTFFRPQWIFWKSERFDLSVNVWALKDSGELMDDLEVHVGMSLDRQRVNAREDLAVPGVLGGLLGRRAVRDVLRKIPGAKAVRKKLSRPAERDPQRPFGLSPAETEDVQAFAARFFQRDHEEIALLQAGGGR